MKICEVINNAKNSLFVVYEFLKIEIGALENTKLFIAQGDSKKDAEQNAASLCMESVLIRCLQDSRDLRSDDLTTFTCDCDLSQ